MVSKDGMQWKQKLGKLYKEFQAALQAEYRKLLQLPDDQKDKCAQELQD